MHSARISSLIFYHRRARRVTAAFATLLVAGLIGAAVAYAFYEAYGYYAVGNNGYVQSEAAHTFINNVGVGETNGRLACQLFNNKNANEVNHGNGACAVFYGGGEYVWARVYNETGATEVIGGEAEN